MFYKELHNDDWVYVVGNPQHGAPYFYSSGRAVRLMDMERASKFKPRVFGVIHNGLFDIVENDEQF